MFKDTHHRATQAPKDPAHKEQYNTGLNLSAISVRYLTTLFPVSVVL